MSPKQPSNGSLTHVSSPVTTSQTHFPQSAASHEPPPDIDIVDTHSAVQADENAANPAAITDPSNDDVEKGCQSLSADSHSTTNPDKGTGDKKEASDADAALDPNVVSFASPTDPSNPQNYPFRRKCAITSILASLTFSTTFTSSIFSTSISATSNLYGLSTTIMTLGTSLFLLGFTLGPIIWGPMSEVYGRKPPLIVGVGAMALFQVGVAVAANAYTILICRFFAGVFGVSPLCVVGGALADFWDPVQRGVAVGIYSMCTFVGPVAAPIVGGYVAESYLGWRWTEYLSVIMALLSWAIAVVWMPETSHARLLQFKARVVRQEMGDGAIHGPADEKQITVRILVERYLTRPFRMVRQEPILCSLCVYIGLTYGILYLFLTAYPYSFERERGWSQGKAGLPFLSITIGVIAGGLWNSYYSVTQFSTTLAQSTKEGGGEGMAPEARLPPMILGGLLLPPGLFWWGWTSSPSISPWPQILAGVPMGAGILLILVNGLNYIVDVYKCNANSAIAANTIIRCTFGAVFPMFAEEMYRGIGVPWATSTLGFAALVMSAGPVVFWKWGKAIRRRSRFVLES